MRTRLPINPALGGYELRIDPPLTDDQLYVFCRLNDIARVERTREGVIQMMSPSGTLSDNGNSEIILQLRAWWKTHRRGCAYGSNAGFTLPDGSMMSPNAAYCTAERLATVTLKDRERFAHVCPDFVIELLSRTDSLKATQRKMELWIENGAQVAWLVNPRKKEVLVYTAGTAAPEVVSGPAVEGSGPVEGFRLDLEEVWSCYL